MQHNAERKSKKHKCFSSLVPGSDAILFRFNTLPNHCALVSPAISSNLATLNWILCKDPSVLWGRHTLFSAQRAFSDAVVFWMTPGLTLQTGTAGVTFHFLLAMGKRSIPRRGGPFSSAAPPPLLHLSKCGWLQLQSDLAVGVMHTHRAIKPLRPTFIISKKESWVSDLLLSFNLLDDIPLASNVLGFQNVFYASFPTKASHS